MPVAHDTDPRPHAVVIGAGFGGLAAAIRLGARGWRVTILERQDAPGGRAGVLRQGGYTFDRGPTIITAPHLLSDLWALRGRTMDVALRPLDPFYRIRFDDGRHFDYSGDPQRMRAEIARFAPRDVDGFDRLMKLSGEIFRIGFEGLVDKPFSSFLDMVRVAPDLLRLHGYRSVHSVVAAHISDPSLRAAFSFHPLLIGGDPFRASAIYCLIAFLERKWGVHFAMGGTGALVDGLARLVADGGGLIRCGATVSRIDVERGRATGVTLEGGERIAADIVVSNADSAWTYRKLLAPEHRRRWTDAKLDRARYSMGLFVWYFGTKRRYDDLRHHTILMGPRYRELLRDIFDRHVLADDFSLYLHRPTATDPSLAPPGGDTFYALSPVPNLRGDIDWNVAGETYRKRIEEYLTRHLMPGLADEIVVSSIATPLDFQDRYLSCEGAGFGLEPTLLQSAWFRPHNRSEEVDNLYLVGAGTHPGAGVPGVIASAKILDTLVPHGTAFAHV
jgi:phytoene desaturase